MNRPACVAAIVLVGLAGELFLLAHWFFPALGIFALAGTLAHFLTRHALSHRPGAAASPQDDSPGLVPWLLIALTGLLLPVLRLTKVDPRWLHLDALGYLAFSLLPVLRIVGREGLAERWRRRWPMALLVILAVAVGGYCIEQIPISVHGDEGEMGCRARQILRGRATDLFAPGEWYSIPNLFFGIAALGLYVFGDNLFGLRMHVLVLGLGVVFFTYLAAERLWGRRSACFATLVLIGNHYFIHLMRCGVGYTQATFFGSVVFYCFARFYDDRDRAGSYAWIHLGGVAMGLGCLSYQANHILPLLWVILFLYVWLMHRIDWRLLLRGLAGAYLALLLMVSPLLLVARGGNRPFLDRSQQVMIWSEQSMRHLDGVYQAGGDRLRIWKEQFKRALFAPTVYKDTSVQYRGPAPLLDPVGAGLFMLGVVMACWSMFHVREVLTLLCVVPVLVIGAALTVDAPFYPRIAGVVPFLALTVGRTLDRLVTPRSQQEKCPALGAYAGISTMVLAGILVINLHLYFQSYRPDRSIHYPVTAMARCIARHGKESITYFVVPPEFYFNLGTIRFLASGHRGYDVPDPAETIPRILRDSSRPILFIIGKYHTNAIPLVRSRFPNAEFANHFNPDGVYLFTSALVPPTFGQ